MSRSFGFPSNNNNSASTATRDESWKAGGFINVHIKYADGRTPKLGAIPLRIANADEKALLDWLASNPEVNSKALAESLVIDFKAVRNDGSKFAGLPGFNPPVAGSDSKDGKPPF